MWPQGLSLIPGPSKNGGPGARSRARLIKRRANLPRVRSNGSRYCGSHVPRRADTQATQAVELMACFAARFGRLLLCAVSS